MLTSSTTHACPPGRRAAASALATLLTALAAVVAVAGPQGAQAATDSRAAVVDAFYDQWLAHQQVPVSWNGDTASCTAGAPGAAAQAATVGQVNYFRGLYGLAPVRLDPVLDDQAQQAALMMQANDTLSHSPDPSWRCWTQAGDTGARQGNLALGVSGAAAVTAFMTDAGDNPQAGHRRWILNPTTTTIGAGSTSRAAALQVMGGMRDAGAPQPEWLPYPAAGWFPDPLEPEGRWSISASDSATDFRGASVSMSGPDGAVPLTVHPVADGYGPDTLVWDASGLRDARVGADVTYRVTIAGVTRGGTALPVLSYSVTLVEPDRALSVAAAPAVGGTARVGETLTASPAVFSPAATAVSWQWLRDGSPVSGATGTSYRLGSADLGRSISVRATGSRTYYTRTTTTSTATAPVVGVGQAAPAPPPPAPTVEATAEPTVEPVPEPTPEPTATGTAPAPGPPSATATGKPTGRPSPSPTVPAPTATTTATPDPSVAPAPTREFRVRAWPRIKGRAVTGRLLRLRPGRVTPKPASRTVAWYRGGERLKVSGLRYRLSRADRGHRIRVVVTFRDDARGRAALTVRSAPTRRVR